MSVGHDLGAAELLYYCSQVLLFVKPQLSHPAVLYRRAQTVGYEESLVRSWLASIDK